MDENYEGTLDEVCTIEERIQNKIKYLEEQFLKIKKIPESENELKTRRIENIIYLLTLIQLDNSWADIEREMGIIADANDIQSDETDDEDACLCKILMKSLLKNMKKWNRNDSMESIMKFEKELGFEKNFENKTSNIDLLENEMCFEILYFFDSFIEVYNEKLEVTSCSGCGDSPCFKMKSKHANEQRIEYVFCNFILMLNKDEEIGMNAINKEIEVSDRSQYGKEPEISESESDIEHMRIDDDNENMETAMLTRYPVVDGPYGMIVINAERLIINGDTEDDSSTDSEVGHTDDKSINTENSSENKSTITDEKYDGICKICKGNIDQINEDVEDQKDEIEILKEIDEKDEDVKVEEFLPEIIETTQEICHDSPSKEPKLIPKYGLLVLTRLTDNLIQVKWMLTKFYDVKGYGLYMEEKLLKIIECPSQGMIFFRTSSSTMSLKCVRL